MVVLLSEGVPMVRNLSDSIYEVSVCLKVCQWSAAYQIPSYEPAGIYEVSVIADYCRYHPMSQQASVRCVPGTDGTMSRPLLQIIADSIHEP